MSIHNSISQLKSQRTNRTKLTAVESLGLTSPAQKVKPRNSIMSTQNKLPKLEDSIMMSADEDQSQRLNNR